MFVEIDLEYAYGHVVSGVHDIAGILDETI